MKSPDRDLFGVTIKQHTANKFVSVTDLQKAYDKGRWIHGWTDRKINHVLSTKETKERLYFLLKERLLIKAEMSAFMEMVDKEGIVKALKELGMWKTSGRGENKSVYCDPYIWVLLAMELNPLLYAKVIIWITDTLIFDRIEAGSEYMPMNAAIKQVIPSPDYARYAREINTRVFGRHITGMRNLASSKDLRLIADIEKFIIKAIENKYIHKECDILEAISQY